MAESEVPEWMDGWEEACLVLDWRPSTASLRSTDTYSGTGGTLLSLSLSHSQKDVRGTQRKQGKEGGCQKSNYAEVIIVFLV